MSEHRIGTVVTHDLTLDCVDSWGRWGRVVARLRFDPAEPWAVTLAFRVPGESVEWAFSRDLLHRGVIRATGDGDVRILPGVDDRGRPEVGIRLSSPDGSLVARTPSVEVRHFLAATHRAVRPGEESAYADLDALVEALLSG